MTQTSIELVRIAFAKAEKKLETREKLEDSLRPNSFAYRGNDKGIANARNFLQDVASGKASTRQINYWSSLKIVI